MEKIVNFCLSADGNLICFGVSNHESVTYSCKLSAFLVDPLAKLCANGQFREQGRYLSNLILTRLNGFQALPGIP